MITAWESGAPVDDIQNIMNDGLAKTLGIVAVNDSGKTTATWGALSADILDTFVNPDIRKLDSACDKEFGSGKSRNSL
jgi:hypothetical protein